ncbi:hypothetical protein QYF61_002010 [Mycteria americana]|uniref:Uncharacterized protein n=1 Tax=Mycteria americana TaxID=33587 RepID=A0AAN7SGJ5_MYCAM|nr:hypothetical protein QYF61_002010 [Mycteria americana]
MVIGEGSLRAREKKYYSNLQEGQEGGPRKLLVGQPHLNALEGDEANPPGKHFKTYARQEGTQGISCLVNLTAFYEKITSSVDNVRTADIVYLYFSKAFDTAFHITLTVKLISGLDNNEVDAKQAELPGLISSTKSNSVNSVITQGSILFEKRSKEVLPPIYSALVRQIWSAGFSSGLPSKRET